MFCNLHENNVFQVDNDNSDNDNVPAEPFIDTEVGVERVASVQGQSSNESGAPMELRELD